MLPMRMIPLLLASAAALPLAADPYARAMPLLDDPWTPDLRRFDAPSFGGRRSGGRDRNRGELTTERLIGALTAADTHALCAAHERRLRRRSRNIVQRDARLAGGGR